jgi:hypothetical protein
MSGTRCGDYFAAKVNKQRTRQGKVGDTSNDNREKYVYIRRRITTEKKKKKKEERRKKKKLL